jgi:hypothetical protein
VVSCLPKVLSARVSAIRLTESARLPITATAPVAGRSLSPETPPPRPSVG